MNLERVDVILCSGSNWGLHYALHIPQTIFFLMMEKMILFDSAHITRIYYVWLYPEKESHNGIGTTAFMIVLFKVVIYSYKKFLCLLEFLSEMISLGLDKQKNSYQYKLKLRDHSHKQISMLLTVN